jgi:hypothetical protein
MKPENLRVRVLDVLELGPATMDTLSKLIAAHPISIRKNCRVLELDNQIECIDSVHTKGRPWKVYAIKGSAECHSQNARGGV